jgi:protein required for attachment to host cells
VRTIEHAQSRGKNRDINTDRPGRVRKGPRQSAVFGMEPSALPKEMEARRFAGMLNHMLKAALDRHALDAVVLVAPPRFLGLLDNCLDRQLRKHVLQRVPKDLTHLRAHELSADLGQLRYAPVTIAKRVSASSSNSNRKENLHA